VKTIYLSSVFLGGFFISGLCFGQQLVFSDVAQVMGIQFPIQNYYGSVSFVDFDNDGLNDLSFSSRTGYPLYIFKNEGNTFTNVAEVLDLDIEDWSMQLLWFDYDNDGDKDLFVAFDNETTHNKLFRNNGNGTFTDVTIEAGLGTQPATTHVAACGDYNNDGWLDLYVTHYSEYTRNFLFKNNGNGTFTDVTIEAGVAGESSNPGFYKLPLAVTFLDYNNDGWADIYVANDHHTGNFLFKNNSDGTFTDVSVSSNTNAEGFMMGIAVGDYNNDGWLDIYTTNDPWGNFLYKNNGDGTFTDVAEDLGVTVNKSCWGTNLFDYNNNGYLDLYVCVEAGIPNNMNYFFKNNGDGTFTQMNNIGLEATNVSFGTAIGDYNNDGFYDIVVNNANNAPNLYRNIGGNNNWVKLKLTGVISNRDAIGTRIEAFFEGRKIIWETTCGISYSSQNSNYPILGVGQVDIVDSIVVKWPASGIVDVLRNVEVNTLIDLTEGETTTGIDDIAVQPAGYKLYQNYPNPFNPSTNISFNLPEHSFVSLKIYNMLGEEIKLLLEKELSPGNYTVDWEAEVNLPSGTYFIRLNTENYSQTIKALLIK
jgi:hypothetical protein